MVWIQVGSKLRSWSGSKLFAKVISRLQKLPQARKMFKYSKTFEKCPLSKWAKIGFQYKSSLNAGQKYCRMLQGEHSAILLTFIKLPFVIKIYCIWRMLKMMQFDMFYCHPKILEYQTSKLFDKIDLYLCNLLPWHQYQWQIQRGFEGTQW